MFIRLTVDSQVVGTADPSDQVSYSIGLESVWKQSDPVVDSITRNILCACVPAKKQKSRDY